MVSHIIIEATLALPLKLRYHESLLGAKFREAGSLGLGAGVVVVAVKENDKRYGVFGGILH